MAVLPLGGVGDEVPTLGRQCGDLSCYFIKCHFPMYVCPHEREPSLRSVALATKLIVCAVRDKAAEVFGQPFFVPAIGLAVRGFQDSVNREVSQEGGDNVMFRHPDQFDLYELGVYHDESGALEADSPDLPRLLMRGLDAKSKR